jgi:hypothetical protein
MMDLVLLGDDRGQVLADRSRADHLDGIARLDPFGHLSQVLSQVLEPMPVRGRAAHGAQCGIVPDVPAAASM